MKKCYKCQKPYVEPNGPGFQDVCEGCQSYLHCCQNCYFYDPYQHNSCTEPMAEYVSDPNGMNRCEYFQFKLAGGKRSLSEEAEGRRFKRADWRNVNKKDGAPLRKRAAQNPFAPRNGESRGTGSRSDKAQKAREALENLFKKP
jgi:hypothetical protein